MSSLSPKDRVSLCSFTFADGRRCRTPRISNHPHFCFYHAQKEARAFAVDKLSKDLAYFFSGDYLSACDLSTALGRLIPAVIRGDLKPKTAHTVAYLAQTLMQAIHVSQHEYCEAFDPDDWREAIRNSVNGNRDYLFPPAPAPEPPAPLPPQPHPAQPPTQAPQPAPSPHTPLPATSAEFVQQVMAGLQTGGRQVPQPAQATPPASQPADTPVNCHSERSRPTFSPASAPANASACVVEESASSSNSSLVTRHSFTPSEAEGPLPRTPAAPTTEDAHLLPATQSTRSAVPAPQPAPAAQPFRSLAPPPHVRRRLHRDPA